MFIVEINIPTSGGESWKTWIVLENASNPRINQYELNVHKNYMHKVAKDAFIPMKNVTKSRYTDFKRS